MSIFGTLIRARDKPKNRVGGGWSFLFGGSSSGKAVNERTAMQTSAVYACVRILAESVAGLPLHVYERTDIFVEEMQMQGFNMIRCIQGARTLSLPMQMLGSDLKAHKVIYNNNPILKWCLTNTGIHSD